MVLIVKDGKVVGGVLSKNNMPLQPLYQRPIVLFGTSQNTGRNPPCNVASSETYLPYCHPLGVGLTSSGYLTPMTV